jgi:hypothetical protein
MSQITIDGGDAIQCVPGSLKIIADTDVRGGDNVPVAVAGEGLSGECEVLVDTVSPLFATLIALRSGVGEGDKDVVWTDILLGSETAYDCLLEVEAMGDGVQTVKIKWKGTKTA